MNTTTDRPPLPARPPYPTHPTPLPTLRQAQDTARQEKIAAVKMDLILLRADNPSVHLPASAEELLTMEDEGWEWDFETDHYTPKQTNAYRPTRKGKAVLAALAAEDKLPGPLLHRDARA